MAQACFRIESILVDACGNPEGANEMVRIKIGPNPLSTSDLSITWPNGANPYLGICQSAQTATKVNAMNAQVQACGFFLEPQNNMLPANATVLIITSADFDVTAHDYAGLTDTLYVIFQCAGNTTGHFANWVDNCNPANGNRTTTISFGAGCSQLVTYNRCSLTNQSGGIGGAPSDRDGARVDFAPNGVASYANDGCTIPYTPLTVNANFVSGINNFCANETVPVQAVVNGTGTNFTWSSSFGTFSDPTSLLTFFTPNPGVSGTITLQFTTDNGCGDPVSATLSATILPEPQVNIQVSLNQDGCNEIAVLNASGANSYLWNNGATSAQITVNQSGNYSVTGTNNCGTDNSQVNIELSQYQLEFTVSSDTTICAGTTAILEADGNLLFTWVSDPTILQNENGLIVVRPEIPQLYSVTATDANGCQATQSVFVDFFPTVSLEISPNAFGFLGDSFDLWAMANQPGNYFWSPTEFLSCVNCQETTSTPSSTITYTVSFIDTNGCITTEQVQVRLESTLYIPNAFSPNDDGINDEFRVGGADLDEFQLDIFNRWGELIITLSSYADSWDGTYKNRLSPEGVYPWILRFRDNDGLQYERTGHVSLIRRGE
jgi:gliding motility-associated-like protein